MARRRVSKERLRIETNCCIPIQVMIFCELTREY